MNLLTINFSNIDVTSKYACRAGFPTLITCIFEVIEVYAKIVFSRTC